MCYNVIMKDEVIHIRVDKAFKKELENEAKSEGRSLSNYLEQVIRKRKNKEQGDENPNSD